MEYQLSSRLWKAQAGPNNADKLKGFLVSWSFCLELRKFPVLSLLGFASFKGQKPYNGFQFTGFWDRQVHL